MSFLQVQVEMPALKGQHLEVRALGKVSFSNVYVTIMFKEKKRPQI